MNRRIFLNKLGLGSIVPIITPWEKLTSWISSFFVKKQPFSTIVGPILHRTYPELLAKELVSVQPLTAPSGAIFHLDYVTGNEGEDRMDKEILNRMFKFETKEDHTDIKE